MSTFMGAYFPDASIRCQLSAGDAAVDAVLLDERGLIIRQIQITFAIDGRPERLRLRELTRVGQVDALGRPVESGHGRNRIVTFPATGVMTPHRNIVDEMLSRVRERIESKSAKGYDPKFALVVGFNDCLLNPEDRDAFVRLKAHVLHNFSEVYLVGVHGFILVPERHSSQNRATST